MNARDKKAAIIGGGVIGGGWAARFLLNGWDVAVFDPAPDADRKIHEVLDNARRSLPALYDRLLPEEGTLEFHTTLGSAVADAGWIQESVPERLDIKHKVLGDISQLSGQECVIGSSTSGFTPSALTEKGARAIVAHPFNPVYLLPVVELVGDARMCATAKDILVSIGMKPLVLKQEIDAHVGDRLLEAVWREALWLVRDGICTTQQLDDVIRFGFGLRWAQMGLFETYRIAGGETGMRHFLAQFGPALKWPWSRLMDVPDLTDELVDLIAGQSDDQSGHMSIRDLERQRDDNLVAMMRALKHTRNGAGALIAGHEMQLTLPQHGDLPITEERKIPTSWTDYNGHMNETHYLELGARANDRFMELIGCDADYIAAGGSYFTLENQIRYLQELHAGETVTVTTQVLAAKGKSMHLFHFIRKGDETLSATVESLLLHVDLNARKSSEPAQFITDRLQSFADNHANLETPEGAGRFVGQR